MIPRTRLQKVYLTQTRPPFVFRSSNLSAPLSLFTPLSLFAPLLLISGNGDNLVGIHWLRCLSLLLLARPAKIDSWHSMQSVVSMASNW